MHRPTTLPKSKKNFKKKMIVYTAKEIDITKCVKLKILS